MNSATGQVKPVVLFGESVTALGAAWCLRKHPITVVSAKFVRRLASHSRFVRRWLRLPDRSPDPLFACLEELREREGELLLFPCSDAWIDVLGRDLQRTRRIGRMLPESPAHLAATLDKLVFGRQVRAQGLPAPEVYSECVSPDWAPPQYPLVLKPYSTYRLEVQYGVKALIIHNREEWQMFAEMFPNQTSFLAQEYLDGPSISVCFCTTVDSRLAGAYVTEKTHYHSMRIGTRVASADRPEAIELTAEFVRRCGFVGFGELEMIAVPRGLQLIELNARPWSQVVMSDALGVPILEMAARLMQAEAIPLRQDKPVDPLEWISWDADLIYRHAMSRAGKPVEPSRAPRHIYPISFMRDPVPALIHALLHSRLGPRRFF